MQSVRNEGGAMIKFQKFQGTGNDFIIFKEDDIGIIHHGTLAKKVCHRNFGIGADGMMVVGESAIADIKMSFYNADGSIATMCGNGIRCFAKFVYENNMVNNKNFEVETLAGIMKVELAVEKDTVVSVTVNLGKPLFFADEIPKTVHGNPYIDQEIQVDGKRLKISSLVIGTIHTVMIVNDFNEMNVEKIGEAIENHELFPRKTNVNFCRVIDKGNIEVLTWEKGVGMTLACGTGAAASFIISAMLKDCDQKVQVQVKGGQLVMEDRTGEIFMTGPARLICEGVYHMERSMDD